MINKPTDPAALRIEAEARVARKDITLVNPQPGEDLLHELMHELKVHQIELEMQNEELRRVQVELEESRDRYVDLYEFAPVVYFTLTREGMIAEANLTGANLLGTERRTLLKRRFAGFVAIGSRDHWNQHFLRVVQHDGRFGCELEIQPGDAPGFHARLDCQRVKADDAFSVRIALIDLTSK